MAAPMVTKFISNADQKWDEQFAMWDWVSVNKFDDPNEHQAWAAFRLDLGCQFIPRNYTVPSPFPPTGQLAKQDYIDKLKEIRRHNRWTDARATQSLRT
jgi:hypothetical protein